MRLMTVPAGTSSRFAWRLVLIAVAGVVLRIAYDTVVLHRLHLGLDSTWYYLEAGLLRRHHSYADPSVFVAHRLPTAAHPPAYPAFLALVQSLFGDSVRTSQLAGLATGAATIVLTGLLARRITDDATALVSAVLVASSPLLIAVDGSLMSETLFVPLALGIALTSAVARETDRPAPWVLAGVLVALAALTRAEALVLFPCLVLPAAILGQQRPRRRVVNAAVAGAAAMVILVPWVARNAIRVHEPTIATVSSATAVGGANCDATYSGDAIGAWDIACTHPELRSALDEAAFSRRNVRNAADYARGHVTRLPIVLAARIARAAGAWSPSNQARIEQEETRNRRWQTLVVVSGPAVLLAGAFGITLLARRRRPIAVLVGLLTSSAVIVVLGWGNTRFRAAAEPALLIGVAVCLTAFVRARGVGTATRAVEP
jgi:4-amino-4-deoxy-L-arabinose transferase-like glycosyltransferase